MYPSILLWAFLCLSPFLNLEVWEEIRWTWWPKEMFWNSGPVPCSVTVQWSDLTLCFRIASWLSIKIMTNYWLMLIALHFLWDTFYSVFILFDLQVIFYERLLGKVAPFGKCQRYSGKEGKRGRKRGECIHSMAFWEIKLLPICVSDKFLSRFYDILEMFKTLLASSWEDHQQAADWFSA